MSILKSGIRILAVLMSILIALYGFNTYRGYIDYNDVKEICSSIKIDDAMDLLIEKINKNNWHINKSNNSVMNVSILKYGCFCVIHHENGKVIKNYGAYCQD